MNDEVVRERRGNVLVARLNRPEARNALNATVVDCIGGAVVQMAEVEYVSVYQPMRISWLV